jgi:hypothetical protein
MDAFAVPRAPRSRTMSDIIDTGSECRSPAGAPSTTEPRGRPRRTNRGPRRPISRITMPVARCSTAMSS